MTAWQEKNDNPKKCYTSHTFSGLNLKRQSVKHTHADMLTGVFGCYFSEQWGSKQTHRGGEGDRDTALVQQTTPHGHCHGHTHTHILTHMEQVFNTC